MSEDRGGGVQIDVLRALRIDFYAGTITLESADGTTVEFKVVRESMMSIEPSPGNEVPSAAQHDVPTSGPVADTAPTGSSTQKTVRLVGKLKSTPRAGRPDGKGRPTAWAKLAVHEDGRDGARMFSTTFHGSTTNKALALLTDTIVIVEGYLRLSDDPKRMDAFSAFNVIIPNSETES